MKEDTRNYGIDALKILAMCMVLILHILAAGGILDAVEKNSVQYHVAWIMEIGAYCAVNIFALTTGYLMINNKWRMSRILGMWLQVFCYSFGLTVIGAIIAPERVTTMHWVRSIFPVSFGLWWYITAYFGLFLFMPFLNKMLHALSKKQAFFLAFIILIICSAWNTLLIKNDLFNIQGYSCSWLVSMYIIGALIRKYDFASKVKKGWWLLVYFGCIIAIWASRLLIDALLNGSLKDSQWVGNFIKVDMFMTYVSPFVVMMSIALLLFFAKCKFPRVVCKVLKTGSLLSFAVYIIHMHNTVYSQIITGKYAFLASKNVFVLVGGVLLATIVIFLACILVEMIRVWVFKLCRIDKMTNKLGGYLDKKVGFDKQEPKKENTENKENIYEHRDE